MSDDKKNFYVDEPHMDVPDDVREGSWQWRPSDSGTAFAPPFGTVRVCRHCGCLVAGGPTACKRCVQDEVRKMREDDRSKLHEMAVDRVRELEERLAEANARADRSAECVRDLDLAITDLNKQLREERDQHFGNESRREIVLDPPSGKERDNVDWLRPFVISGNRCKIRAVNTDMNGYVIYLVREKL